MNGEASASYVVRLDEILTGVSQAYAAYDPFSRRVWGAGDSEEEADQVALANIAAEGKNPDEIDLLIERVGRRRPVVHLHR